MKKLLLGIVVIVGIGIYFGIPLFQKPEISLIDDSAPIIFFGDSLVYGVGAARGDTMPKLLSDALGREVINKGIPGDTTRDGVHRLEEDVLALKPGLVLLLLGGNDYLQKIDPDETFLNLELMIDRIEETGAQVLLIGVRGGVLLDGFDTEFAKLARRKDIAHIPDILDKVLMDPTLKADQVHPNDAGYQKMTERLLPAVQLYLRK